MFFLQLPQLAAAAEVRPSPLLRAVGPLRQPQAVVVVVIQAARPEQVQPTATMVARGAMEQAVVGVAVVLVLLVLLVELLGTVGRDRLLPIAQDRPKLSLGAVEQDRAMAFRLLAQEQMVEEMGIMEPARLPLEQPIQVEVAGAVVKMAAVVLKL